MGGTLLLLFFFALPILLTVLNLVNLVRRNIFESIAAIFTLIIGFVFSILWFEIAEYSEWYVVRRLPGQANTPLSGHYVLTLLVLFCLSIVGFLILRFFKELPPIISALCIASLLLGCLLTILYMIQVGSRVDLIHLYVANVWLIYLQAIRQKSFDIAEIEMVEPYRLPVLKSCTKLLNDSLGWTFFSFWLMFPIVAVAIIILTLFGQRPDAIIQVFTYTADWTFSQQISPPIEYLSGHYLCTVAAGGDPKLVKPLRYGHRHGNKIIVNRQLCIANAFEQYIMEKFPRTHRAIRGFYDKYGYPVSKHIITTRRANVTYFLMKPLEWMFVIFLYTFDKYPENRIANQYVLNLEKVD